MINLSEAFSVIDNVTCIDVFSSLEMQGATEDISIPLYGPIFGKILSENSLSYVCNHIGEYTALRRMIHTCGAVNFAINIADIDILTMMVASLVATPNTGMHVFLKNTVIDIASLSDELVEMLCEITNLPLDIIPLNGVPLIKISNTLTIVSRAVDILYDGLINYLNNDMLQNGIEIHQWEEYERYINMLVISGEMKNMQVMRAQIQSMNV